MRVRARVIHICWIVLIFTCTGAFCDGQAAVLMEQPYGLSRVLNPTGHIAIYFARICAATPTRLRRCAPGELGSVIARYNGINGYDWVAIPLVAYLYAVDSAGEVPAHVDHATVKRLRRQYHREHLMALGTNLPEGGLIRRGWNQLAGSAYSRSIYAFRFSTTAAEDDRLIARLNRSPNRSHFHILWNNCADFAADILDLYFPGVFHRRILPDLGIVTPRQIAYELQGYAEKHRDVELAVFEIPQVPGYRRASLQNKSVVESFIVSGDILPVAVFAPYVAAGLGADFVIWGRYPLDLRDVQRLEPQTLDRLAGNGLAGDKQAEASAPGREQADLRRPQEAP